MNFLRILLICSALLSSNWLVAQMATVTKLSPILEKIFPEVQINSNGSFSYEYENSIVVTRNEGITWDTVPAPSLYKLDSYSSRAKHGQLTNGQLVLYEADYVHLQINDTWMPLEINGDTVFSSEPWIVKDQIFVARDNSLFRYDGITGQFSEFINKNCDFDECFSVVYTDDRIIIDVNKEELQIFDNQLNPIETISIQNGGDKYISKSNYLVYKEDHFNLTDQYSSSIQVSKDDGETFERVFYSPGQELEIIGTHKDKIYFRFSQNKSEAWSNGHYNAKVASLDLNTNEINVIYEGRNQKVRFNSYMIDGNLWIGNGAVIIKYGDGDFSKREVILNQSSTEIANITKLRQSTSGVLYAQSEYFLYKSMDRGLSWHLILDYYTIADFDLTESDRLYVISNDRILQSDDEGESFTALNYTLSNGQALDFPYEIISLENEKLVIKAVGHSFPDPQIFVGCSDCFIYHPTLIYTSTNNGDYWRTEYVFSDDFPFVTASDVYGMTSDIAINSDNYLRTEEEVLFTQFGQITALSKSNLQRRHHRNFPGNFFLSGFTLEGDLVLVNGLQVSLSQDFGQSFTDLPFVPAGKVFTTSKPSSIYILDNVYNEDRKQLYYLSDYSSPFIALPVFYKEGVEQIEVKKINSIFTSQGEEYILAEEGLFRMDNIEYFDSKITGVVYADTNEDCNVLNEEAINAVDLIKVEGNGLKFFALVTNGHYEINLPSGEWTLTPVIKNSVWQSCQVEFSATTITGQETYVNVGLQTEMYCADLTAHISNLRLRRCFESEYFIHISNKGTEDANAAEILVETDAFHEQVTFDLPFTDLGNNRYQLDLGNLTINEKKEIIMTAVISCDAPLGYSHCINVEAVVDNYCMAAETYESFYQENVGAFDPNDIRLFNSNGFEDRYFDVDEYQYYQIRFQNTGTDTAFTVVIKDEIDHNLDVESLEILSASHLYKADVDFNNRMTLQFDNILLPDSTTNLAASQGMFSYRIKPKAEVGYGTGIRSKASIYFDRNAPVETNVALAIIREHCDTPIVTEVDYESCGPYWGHRYTGRYRDVFRSADGCDSIRFVNLSVKQEYEEQIEVVICDREEFEGVVYENQNLNESTFYQKTKRLQTVEGCDSIIRLSIEVKPPWDKLIENVTICSGESYQGQTTSGSFFSNDTETCTAVYLTVLPDLDEEINMTICEGESFLGYSATGTYFETIQEGDCDGVKTINLTVLNELNAEQKVSICEGESYEGYNLSGTYEDNYISADGCDSVRVLILNVIPITQEIIIAEICEGESFQGYISSGIYEDTFNSVEGCDSIRILNLEVYQSNDIFTSIEICEGDNVEGFTTTGTYINETTNQFGCDSLVTLELLVHPSYRTEQYVQLCPGEDYNGITQAGEYEAFLTSTQGCDSIHTIYITLLDEDDVDCLQSSIVKPVPSSLQSMIVMPNPTNGQIKIETGETKNEIGTLKIYSINKQLILKSKVRGAEISCDLSEMESGIYLIQVQYRNRIYASKVIKI